METFGKKIKRAREQNSLLLRQVAHDLNIDQAIISKFERNARKPTRSQVVKFAEFYNLNKDELLIAWLSDKITGELMGEKVACEVLKVAGKKVRGIQKLIA